MAIDPTQLLRKLEPAVRPTGSPATTRRPHAPFEKQSFDQLLTMVSSGSVNGGKPVMIDPHADLKDELDDGQLDRLTCAADMVEASGARRAVMLIDGRGLILDVSGRRLTAELSVEPASQLINIDAAVYVAGEDETSAISGAPPAFPGSGLIPPEVARQFEPGPDNPMHPDDARVNEESAGDTRRAG